MSFTSMPSHFALPAISLLWIGSIAVAQAHGTHMGLMSMIDEKIAKEPNNGEFWCKRALLLYEHEDWAEVLVSLDQAEKLAPGKFPVLLWKGKALDQQGKLAEGKFALDAFLEKNPNHPGGLASRARIELKLGLQDHAITDFRAALKNEQHVEPDLVQEVAQALVNNDMVDESINLLELSLEQLGNVPSLQIKIVEVEVSAGRYDSALSRVATVQSMAIRPELWMEKRASILAQAGRIAESRVAWEALTDHLDRLPAAEKSSHAMTLFSERAHQALSAIHSKFITP
jgi:predicted Zn-dependent protease